MGNSLSHTPFLHTCHRIMLIWYGAFFHVFVGADIKRAAENPRWAGVAAMDQESALSFARTHETPKSS